MEKYSTVTIVSACALIGESDRILLQRRREGGSHGGLWEFPGGKMERFESPESALIRELDEELAITLYESELVPVTFAAGPAAPNRPDESLVILLYSCRTWRGDPRCLAGEELAWFEASRINDLAMPPLDYPLAEGLIVALETGRS